MIRHDLPVALQPIGCEHLRTVDMTRLGDRAPVHRCVDCPAEWSDRRHRVRHWDDATKLAQYWTDGPGADRLSDLAPDPRISTLRPAWLADDQDWRDQLQAMDLADDVRWVERHWDMAGGAKAAVDMSWVKTRMVGGVDWLAECVTLGVLIALVGAIFVATCYAVGIL